MTLAKKGVKNIDRYSWIQNKTNEEMNQRNMLKIMLISIRFYTENKK